MRDWVHGSHDWQSIAFLSDGTHYNVPKGLIFSLPVTTANGKYKVVEGLKIDDAETQHRIKLTTDELIGERQAVEHLMK